MRNRILALEGVGKDTNSAYNLEVKIHEKLV